MRLHEHGPRVEKAEALLLHVLLRLRAGLRRDNRDVAAAPARGVEAREEIAQAFPRAALLARVWKGDTFVTERNVDTLVKRIRRKIEPDAAEPALILTVWGTGYKAADV